ncbi:alpha/beta fold hydrolase [Cellulomonas wangleii]|uniref:alpha/beta fold hydrolase n=1 Tax=Cellulomonas wangleii TaxID=2816956 RepID=UPI00355900D3
MLLHGFPQDASAYDAVVPLLTDAGVRTLVPDQRGYSPGARPRGRRPYAVRELVADVVALLDAAEHAHVAGHDWGGGIAWALAAHRPDRVASLTALGTPHPAAMRSGLLRGQALRSWYIGAFQVPRLPERALLADDGARRAHRRDRLVPRAPARRVGDRACRPGPDDVRLGPSGPVLRTGVDLDADHWLPEHRPADVAAAVLGQVRA